LESSIGEGCAELLSASITSVSKKQNQAKKASAQSTKASTPIPSKFALAPFVDDEGDEDEDDPSVILVLAVLVVVAVVADPSVPTIRRV
jgi:hypothetical protein